MITKIVSFVSLGLIVVPSLLFWFGLISLDMVKMLALAATLAWFASTPVWMRDPDKNEINESPL